MRAMTVKSPEKDTATTAREDDQESSLRGAPSAEGEVVTEAARPAPHPCPPPRARRTCHPQAPSRLRRCTRRTATAARTRSSRNGHGAPLWPQSEDAEQWVMGH